MLMGWGHTFGECVLHTLTGVTSTVSQSIGTPAAWKIFCTAAEISGPIPSPGISVILRTSEAKFLVVIAGVMAGELTWKIRMRGVYYTEVCILLRNVEQKLRMGKLYGMDWYIESVIGIHELR